MRNPLLFLKEIHGAMEAAEAFVEGMTFDAFVQDFKTKSAVVRQFEVMGEAARMVPASIRASNPEVNWTGMCGMRNRLIHAYWRIDFSLLWDTIKDIFPRERSAIGRIIKELGEGCE